MIIKAKKGFQLVDLKELIEYRDLFYFLVVRDIKVRYKQTVLGGLWAVIQPFFLMAVFTLFFGRLVKIPYEGVPYPVFNFSATVIWIYFANAITNAGNCLIGENSKLISKVYFPRLIIPLASILAGLLDFAIAFVVLIGMMLFFHIYPAAMIVFLPLLVILMVLAASGVGMFLAALNVQYRDIRYAIPFLVQLWMFATPIIYPASMVPERYRLIYILNPMVGITEGFRSVLLGTIPFPGQMLLVSTLVSAFLFIFGFLYFKHTERYFADII